MMYVQSLSTGGTIFWKELHSTITTNSFGLFTLVVGTGTRQPESTVATFDLIDWSVTPKYLKTEIYYSGSWKNMGTSQLLTVPYAMIAEDLAGSVKKLAVEGETSGLEEALFEVKNKDGQTVFAVYNEGVRIYVSNGAKAVKGGFAVGGFGTDKAESTKYLFVGKDSVRIYLDTNPLTKGKKSGFVVGGYDITKGTVQNYLDVSEDSVRVYIDSNPATKATKGGFAVGGYDMTKGTSTNYMDVNTDATGIINPSQNRILWYPLKNAFLTGRVLIESSANVGQNSFATGYEAKAKGMYSQAMGFMPQALGDYSTAIGNYATATSNNSFAFGDNATASNDGAYAFGSGAIASGPNSYALGLGCLASGENSFALGWHSQAVGSNCFAMGFGNKALGGGPTYAFGNTTISKAWGATTFGWYTKADAEHALAMGSNTLSNSYCALVLGQANDTTVMHYSTSWMGSWDYWWGDDPIFIIGNGDVDRFVDPPVVTSRSNAFIILKSGATGINMNRPSYMLDVNGEIASRNNNAFRLRNTTYSNILRQDNSDFFMLVTNSGDPDGTWSTYRPLRINNSTGNVYLGSSDAGTNYSMTVTSTGAVGIGTSIPNSNLEVKTSGTNGYAGIGINSSLTGGKLITLNQGVAGKLNFTVPGVVDLVTFDFVNSRVGIGTTSPGSTLTVNGTAWCTSGAWTGSDVRWKKNISPFDNILSNLLELIPVNYDLKTEEFPEMGFEKGKQIGLIAQDVEKIFPELVRTDDSGYKAVSYEKLSVILLEGMKEQQKQIDRLENMVEEMKAMLDNKVVDN
jgi:hypothetical protein